VLGATPKVHIRVAPEQTCIGIGVTSSSLEEPEVANSPFSRHLTMKRAPSKG
jgi:hypothetical protein